MTESTLKKECFDCEFYSFGTTKLFEGRANKYGTRLKRITFLGLLSPIVLGGFVAAFSTDSEVLKQIFLPLCGLLTVGQGVYSLFSLTYKWDEKHSYSIGAIKDNARLTSEFNKLKKLDDSDIKESYQKLREEYDRQLVADTAQSITKEEERYSMRQSLFHFKSKCSTCELVPKKLAPTDCDTCGNY